MDGWGTSGQRDGVVGWMVESWMYGKMGKGCGGPENRRVAKVPCDPNARAPTGAKPSPV